MLLKIFRLLIICFDFFIIGISFTPREAGEHLVNVKRLGNHIQGSPFKINVLDAEIGDASKVKIIGDALKQGKTQTANEFKIDTREAGKYAVIIINVVTML